MNVKVTIHRLITFLRMSMIWRDIALLANKHNLWTTNVLHKADPSEHPNETAGFATAHLNKHIVLTTGISSWERV